MKKEEEEEEEVKAEEKEEEEEQGGLGDPWDILAPRRVMTNRPPKMRN